MTSEKGCFAGLFLWMFVRLVDVYVHGWREEEWNSTYITDIWLSDLPRYDMFVPKTETEAMEAKVEVAVGKYSILKE